MIILLFSLINANIFINIGEPKFIKPNLALVSTCKKTNCEAVFRTINSDLVFANIFTFIPIDNYSKDIHNVASWSASGAKYLIIFDYSNHFYIIKLFDVDTSLKILDYKEPETVRPEHSAHNIADKIYTTLTSRKSIFKTKIAFIARTGSYKNLFIMDYDGKNIKPLTNFKSLLISPAWSPNGAFISYSRYRTVLKNKKFYTSLDLFLYNIKTGVETLISSSGQSRVSGATWSKDGKFIAFTSSKDGDPDLYLYSLEEKLVTPLINKRGIDVEPSFSNDTKKLVYSSGVSGNPELYVYDFNNKESTRITYTRYYNSSPAWSPTKNSIAFAGLDDPFSKGKSFFDIFLINPETRAIDRMTIDAGNNENPSWSFDGRHLVFTSTRNKGSDIYFINEDGTNQRRLTYDYYCYSPSWSNFFD